MPGFFLARFHVEPDSGADVSEAVRGGGKGPPSQPVSRNFLSKAQGTSHLPSPRLLFPFLDLDFRRRDLPQAPGSSHGDPIPGSDGPGLEAIFGATGDAAVLVARLMGIENAISPQKLGKRAVPLSLAGHGTADFASSAAVWPESEARRQQIPDAASPSVRRLPLVSLTSAGIGPRDESRNGDIRGFGVPAWGEKAGRFHAAPSNPAQRPGISSNLKVRWRAGLPDFAI